jgi:predicted murein hydrolase (TIGR00659 family)
MAAGQRTGHVDVIRIAYGRLGKAALGEARCRWHHKIHGPILRTCWRGVNDFVDADWPKPRSHCHRIGSEHPIGDCRYRLYTTNHGAMETITQLLHTEPFTLAFVIGTYIATAWLYKRTKLPFLHPVLMSIAVIILVLMLFDVPYETFKQNSHLIDFMLGPVVVALGYTLYEQVGFIKQNLWSMLTAVVVGSAVGIVSVSLIAKYFGADEALVASLAPKSVTNPIAISLANQFGGIAPLTAVVVVIVGVFGAITGPFILQKMGISSKIAKGLAMGAAAHGIGTARALEMGAIEGAISGLAIGLMGAATALLVPLFRLLGVC